MKILVDLRIYPDTNGRGESRGSPISHNYQRTETLLAALFLGIAFASHSGATVYHSDGSDANVQAIHDTNAHDGDTITLPAGTFTWTTGVNLTKGITVSGQTTITGAGTANCTAKDQTIIVDEKPRGRHLRLGQPRRRPRGTAAALFKATVPAGKSFRLTGVTFRRGSLTQLGNGVGIYSSGGLAQNVRVDHCHFDHLYTGHMFQIGGWIYGVGDHNLFESNGNSGSHLIQHHKWGGVGAGNGSWADYPYYGSEKFWFAEDNTIKGNGKVPTSGGIDASIGGRYVMRHNYFWNADAGGHGTEGGNVRGTRCIQVYNNTFNWTRTWGGRQLRSGGCIFHDNIYLGRDPGGGNDLSNLQYFRIINGVGDDFTKALWGLADGENGWDLNDPHGVYFSGTTTSATTGSVTVSTPLVAHAYQGMQIRNDHVGSASYLHSSYIIDNTTTKISYAYYVIRGAPLQFNPGDEFSIRKVLIALDQQGRGKGDVIAAQGTRHLRRGKGDAIAARGPRHWPNQQQEPCFSWNNKNTDTNTTYRIHSGIPIIHEGTDYINLGSGLPANQIPAEVTAAYPASVNGGSAYDHEYTYPHPLVSGATPTQTFTPTPTSTGTPSPTPTATVTATATPTATHTSTFKRPFTKE